MKDIRKFLDNNEALLWKSRSLFRPLLFGGSFVSLLFGLFTITLPAPLIVSDLFDIFFSSHLSGFGRQLLRNLPVGLTPVFAIPAFLTPLRKQTWYALTDKRVIVQTELTGNPSEVPDHKWLRLSSDNPGYPSAYNLPA